MLIIGVNDHECDIITEDNFGLACTLNIPQLITLLFSFKYRSTMPAIYSRAVADCRSLL